jgi:hypothetical protein
MDIQQTKEAVIGLVKLGKVLAELAKDGVDIKDAAALASKIIGDEAFRGSLVAAIEGVSAIPEEIKDIKLDEGMELALAVIAELKSKN